jgi:hypothetical protein
MVELAAETALPLMVMNKIIAQFIINQQALNKRL